MSSFWGKFGQRENLVKSNCFADSAELLGFAQDPAIEVSSLDILSEYMVHISYQMHEDFVESAPNTNPVIAAFTTAQARLTLYKHLHPLGQRVLYFDTDSVICTTSKTDTYHPHIGS